ncbi:MAG: sugar nucleotide-binding protein [Candidatus Nanohaloarchaea archaeon]|nr:sugar nucleotide-binding protein [Candidatus Nanohaloarchaea archaeon]
MDVAVIGGRGFVGSAVVDELQGEHDVTTVDPRVGGEDHISADITDEQQMLDVLDGFDAVVNLAGLSPMQEPRSISYKAVHVDGAENVAEACEEYGARLVHMSALGADPDADTAYLRTKGEGREAVLDADVDATVVEPSIIYDRGNPLVEMAARLAPTRVFPHLTTRIQPVYRGDVADLFRLAVAGEIDEQVLQVGGPGQMTLYEFVRRVYRANGYPCYAVPCQAAMSLVLQVMEVVPFVPYGADQARFLRFDNTVAENDADRYVELTGMGEWLESAF